MTDSPLPPVFEGELDVVGLNDLRRDLTTLADVLHVQVRRSGCNETGVSLHDAIERVIDRSAQAVQVQYRYQDKRWCDTLIATGSGARLVRISLP